MDGLEATRRIRREIAAERQPRIIAMTADATSEDRKRCLEAGMDGYLSKPVRMDQLAAGLAKDAQVISAAAGSGPGLPMQTVAREAPDGASLAQTEL